MSQPDIRRYLQAWNAAAAAPVRGHRALGTFARAAQELHMAQPTASLQIKKLTATVGVPLFEQVGKRVYLTEAGRTAAGKLRPPLPRVRRPRSFTVRNPHARLGTAAPCGQHDGHVVRVTAPGSFVGNHPGVEISMQAHNRQALVERLAKNEDDLYLFTSAPEIDGVVTQEILSNPFVVLARDDHPLASARHIPSSGLRRSLS
jgi:DNA-binding transcriptional LysR family regulator